MDDKTSIYLTNSSDTDGVVVELNRLGYSTNVYGYTVYTNARAEIAYQVFYSVISRPHQFSTEPASENFN